MILETTYPDKEVTKSINETVGVPFSFKQRIVMGGIGSHRMEISEVSNELLPYINPGHSVNNINIELRPKGVLIHLKRRTETYCWVVPYKKLKTSESFSQISDDQYFIHLKNGMQHNSSFVKKLERLKLQLEN